MSTINTDTLTATAGAPDGARFSQATGSADVYYVDLPQNLKPYADRIYADTMQAARRASQQTGIPLVGRPMPISMWKFSPAELSPNGAGQTRARTETKNE